MVTALSGGLAHQMAMRGAGRKRMHALADGWAPSRSARDTRRRASGGQRWWCGLVGPGAVGPPKPAGPASQEKLIFSCKRRQSRFPPVWLWFAPLEFGFLRKIVVDVGPTGFPSNVTIGRGPWTGPRIEARRGAASATLTSSRIGKTSRIPVESTFCI
jgi:hypothetical protein